MVSSLLYAYKYRVPPDQVLKLLSRVAKILPPLSDSDTDRLSITLPLLSASLENGNLPSPRDPEFQSIVEQLTSIKFDLATYALSAEYETRSRSASATCLYSHIVRFFDVDSPECPAKQLAADVVTPAFLLSFADLTKSRKNAQRKLTEVQKLMDCLEMYSVIVSGEVAFNECW